MFGWLFGKKKKKEWKVGHVAKVVLDYGSPSEFVTKEGWIDKILSNGEYVVAIPDDEDPKHCFTFRCKKEHLVEVPPIQLF